MPLSRIMVLFQMLSQKRGPRTVITSIKVKGDECRSWSKCRGFWEDILPDILVWELVTRQ